MCSTGVPHLIGDAESGGSEESGLIVPPDDPQAMADAIARVIGDPALARSLGAAGGKIAAEYSLETQQETVLSTLRDAYPAAFGSNGR